MTWRKWLPILAGLVLLFSCRDDDDSKTTGVVRFYVPDGSIQNNEHYWIILSNETGQVLDWKPLQNAETYSYTLPGNVNESVTMTTVYSRPIPGGAGFSTSSTITSYANVPAGTYTFDYFAVTGSDETMDPAYLTLSGFSASDNQLEWIYPQGMLTDTTDVDDPDTGLKLELAPLAQKTALLAIVRGELDHYLYTEIEAGETIARSAEDFETFTPQPISIPEGMNWAFLQVSGNNAYGEFPYYSDMWGGPQEVPTAPGIFDSYTLQATMSDPANERSFNVRLTGELPSEMPLLESALQHFTAEDDVVGWKTTTTSLDAVNIMVSKNEAAYSLYWSVVGDGGEQSITLPRIPDDIPLEGVPASVNARSFTALARQDGATFSLLNFPHYTDYQDYLRKHFLYRTDYAPEDFIESTQHLFPQ